MFPPKGVNKLFIIQTFLLPFYLSFFLNAILFVLSRLHATMATLQLLHPDFCDDIRAILVNSLDHKTLYRMGLTARQVKPLVFSTVSGLSINIIDSSSPLFTSPNFPHRLGETNTTFDALVETLRHSPHLRELCVLSREMQPTRCLFDALVTLRHLTTLTCATCALMWVDMPPQMPSVTLPSVTTLCLHRSTYRGLSLTSPEPTFPTYIQFPILRNALIVQTCSTFEKTLFTHCPTIEHYEVHETVSKRFRLLADIVPPTMKTINVFQGNVSLADALAVCLALPNVFVHVDGIDISILEMEQTQGSLLLSAMQGINLRVEEVLLHSAYIHTHWSSTIFWDLFFDAITMWQTSYWRTLATKWVDGPLEPRKFVLPHVTNVIMSDNSFRHDVTLPHLKSYSGPVFTPIAQLHPFLRNQRNVNNLEVVWMYRDPYSIPPDLATTIQLLTHVSFTRLCVLHDVDWVFVEAIIRTGDCPHMRELHQIYVPSQQESNGAAKVLLQCLLYFEQLEHLEINEATAALVYTPAELQSLAKVISYHPCFKCLIHRRFDNRRVAAEMINDLLKYALRRCLRVLALGTALLQNTTMDAFDEMNCGKDWTCTFASGLGVVTIAPFDSALALYKQMQRLAAANMPPTVPKVSIYS